MTWCVFECPCFLLARLNRKITLKAGISSEEQKEAMVASEAAWDELVLL